MKSSLKFLTLVAVLAIGAGVLGGAQDAVSSEKKSKQVAATPSHGEEAAKEEAGGHGAAAEEEEEEAGGHGIRWGYEGKTGPSRWAKLSKDFRLCGRGTTQSPIDISEISGTSAEPIAFDYNLTPVEIVHNGHTVQINY